MADEEVTDLTAEEEPSGGEDKGKKKKEKPPKEKKEKPEKEPKAPGGKKEKGNKSSLGLILILLIIALALIGGYVAALIFNVFSVRAITADFVREPLLNFIVWLDPGFSAVDNRLRDEALAREAALVEWEAALKEREDDLVQREKRDESRETQLNRRAAELDNLEQEVRAMYERTVPIYRRDMSQQELEDMISYATTFARMPPFEAAEVLERVHTINDVASILYYMNERNAAAILAVFEPQFAAAVTDVWLYN